jgi:hypothetical protein
VIRDKTSWNIWAEIAMHRKAPRNWNGSRLERRIVDIMNKRSAAGGIYIGIQYEFVN